jgi:hypothetical protein
MDNDSAVLDELAAAVSLIDKKYRRADPVDRSDLKADRDRAFNSYTKARIKLLADGVLATAADVRKMQEIRAEIGRARATQTIIAGAIKLVAFAAKFA